MTYRRLPSLAARRSFVAAARHPSVTRATGELAVTPGAVSRGVRALEEELGTTLLIRGPAGLALTPTGEALFAATRDGLDRIAAGLAAMRHAAPRRRLRVGAYTFFASRWLIPRWNRLRERRPELEIELQTSADPLELVPGTSDAATAVVDSRPRTGPTMLPLMPIEMMPVCAARLAQDFDWSRVTLLHSRQRPHDWARWLSAAGLAGADPGKGPSFESIALALDAAAEGLGVALVIRALVGTDLAAGRVVAPHPFVRPTARSFAPLHDAEKEEDARLTALRQWLSDEAAFGNRGDQPPRGDPGTISLEHADGRG